MQFFPNSIQSVQFHRVLNTAALGRRNSASGGTSCDSRRAQNYEKIDAVYKSALTA